MDRKTILAIDDSAISLRSVKTVLEDLYSVRMAKTTALASGVLRKEHIDLILLDIEMPGDISGIDYLKVLKAAPETRDIPVIMLTGHSSFETISNATWGGAADYVIKPFDPVVLHEKVLGIFLNQ
ncbi:response regulator [Spirochaetia bacterium]|nr:response regulator [Spirochaetia bacterium]